jgi:hypothetical protein
LRPVIWKYSAASSKSATLSEASSMLCKYIHLDQKTHQHCCGILKISFPVPVQCTVQYCIVYRYCMPFGLKITDQAACTGMWISVVDPKLFFSDPDPIFVRVLDPDSDPLWIIKSYGSSFGSHHKFSVFHNANNKKAFSWHFKAYFKKIV